MVMICGLSVLTVPYIVVMILIGYTEMMCSRIDQLWKLANQ